MHGEKNSNGPPKIDFQNDWSKVVPDIDFWMKDLQFILVIQFFINQIEFTSIAEESRRKISEF